MPRLYPLFFFAVLISIAPYSQAQQSELPTFRQNYTEPSEMLYQAKQHINYLRKSGQLIEDSFAQQYLYDLGNYLASYTQLSAYEFKFYILKDPSINAYAMPGGNIVIHTGLIKASRSLDELVAVIAHEMAHIQRAHLLRRDEKLSDDTLPILAGTLASIALMAVNPQAAMAGITSVQALAAQSAIDTTRGFEWEADEMGIRTMNAAGYNPQAMASFFEQLDTNDSQVPEILLTHPVTQKRISTAQANAAKFSQKKLKQAQEDAIGYPYLKALAQDENPAQPDISWFNTHAPWHLYRQTHLTEDAKTPAEKHQTLAYLSEALNYSAYPNETYRLMARLYFELGEIALSHYQLAKAAETEEDYKQALTQLEIVMSKDPTKRTSYEKLKNEWTEKLKEGRATK